MPIRPQTCRMTSFAVTPTGRAPSTRIRKFFIFCCCSVDVASTCSTYMDMDMVHGDDTWCMAGIRHRAVVA